MSIFHYFSSNVNKRVKFIFNTIAPLYSKVDLAGSSYYLNAITQVHNEIGIANKSVLDVGTGIGDWAAMFDIYGAKTIHGVDFAEKMLAKAKSKFNNVSFSLGDAESLDNFEDNSFDIVTASLVIHGVNQQHREKILSEMGRVAKSHVVLHDFMGKTPAVVKFLEFLEKSDYKHFKQNIETELKTYFSNISSFQIKKGTGIYICEKK